MTHNIKFQTQDEQTIQFSCDQEQTVLAAAEQAGYFPPAMCRDGGCGTCLAHCQTGTFRMDHYSESVLSPQAAARGDVLLCQTYPQSDLSIQVPYSMMQLQQQEAPPRIASISAIETIADRTIRLALQLQDDEQAGLAFDFEPGQYVELEVPELDLKRAYSMASVPNWDGKLEFLIRLQPKGRFSEFVQQTEVGKQLLVYGPSGAFTVQQQHLNPRCFIAGGTGLAPFLSMLRRMVEWGEDHPTHLILGVNNEQELFCVEELNEIEQQLSRFSSEICVWKPQQDWNGFVGTPVDALKIYLSQFEEKPDIYLCGPPVLVESATEASLAAGIDAQRIFSERFVAS